MPAPSIPDAAGASGGSVGSGVSGASGGSGAGPVAAPVPALVIREGSTQTVDAAALSAFAARTFPDACPDSLPQREVDAFIALNLSPEQFERWLADADAHVFVAKLDGEVAAYAVSLHAVHGEGPERWAESRSAYLSKLYVGAELRGRGVSGALFDAVRRVAVSDGCVALWLGVNDENARARGFYAKAGLRAVGRRPFSVGSLHFVDDMLGAAL